MSRASLMKDGLITKSVSDVIELTHNWLTENSWKVYSDEHGLIKAKQGSQLITRLIGGWFVPAKNFPKQVSIKISQSGTQTELLCTFEESLGIGILDPFFKKKYLDYFEQTYSSLTNFLN